MPVGLPFRLVALALASVAMTSCGSSPIRSFGNVAWVGETEEFYRADGPAIAESADEFQRLLTDDQGHRVALRGEPGIDFSRHYVAIIPAVELNGCAKATIDEVRVNGRIVHVMVGHDPGHGQDGCVGAVTEFGLLMTLGRDQWSEPPEVRVEYEVPPLS